MGSKLKQQQLAAIKAIRELIQVSVYDNVKNTSDPIEVPLGGLFALVKDELSEKVRRMVLGFIGKAPSFNLKYETEEIKNLHHVTFEAALASGKTEKEALAKAKDAIRPLKENLPAPTWSGVLGSQRKAEKLVQHSGLLCGDIDGLIDPEVLKWVFDTLAAEPDVFFVMHSPSGVGIKFLVRIPANPETHKAAFATVSKIFKELLQGIEIDASGKDVTRLCFLAHDPDAVVHWDARVFEIDPEFLEPAGKRMERQVKEDGGKIIENDQREHGASSAKAASAAKTKSALADEAPKAHASERKIGRALSFIDVDTLTYDQWLRVGLALHHEAEGDDWALQLWDDWSSGGAKYKPGEPEEKWAGFGDGDGVTIGTLFALAKEHGWDGWEKPGVFLPTRSTSDFCRSVYGIVRTKQKIFVASGSMVTVALTEKGNHQISDVDPIKGIRLFEEEIQFLTTTKNNGETITMPVPLVEHSAKLLVKGPQEGELLPLLGIMNFAPLLAKEGRLTVAPYGYIEETGWFNACKKQIPVVPLEKAIAQFKWLYREFDFPTPGDRARALLFPVGVALKMSGFIHGPVPLDFGVADQQQAGKTKRQQITAALFNDTCVQIVQGQHGYGSLWENFQSSCMVGKVFPQLDNLDECHCPQLESFLTGSAVVMRSAYSRPRFIDPSNFVVALTSNGLATRRDLALRAWFIAIRKRPEGYAFHQYKEGGILEHVRHYQPHYLGCIYAFIREWWERGAQRTTETGHSFNEFTQVCDWIATNILHEAGVMEGHEVAKGHYSDAGRVLFGRLAETLKQANKLQVPYRAGQLGSIALRKSLPIPGMRASTVRDESAAAKLIGAVAASLFEDKDTIDLAYGFTVERLENSGLIAPDDEPEPWRKRPGDTAQYVFRLTKDPLDVKADDPVVIFRDSLLKCLGGAPVDQTVQTCEIAKLFEELTPESAGKWMRKLEHRWPENFHQVTRTREGSRWQIARSKNIAR